MVKQYPFRIIQGKTVSEIYFTKKEKEQKINSNINFNKSEEIVYGKARAYYVSKEVENISPEQYASIILDVGKSLVKNINMPEHQLKLDLYTPCDDTLKKRPLLVFIHGGAFIIGDKQSLTALKTAAYFTSKGYVVASINYRLGYMFIPGAYFYLERCIYRAIQDARAAIRYLTHHEDKYKIDRDNIFTVGNSAGGFIALKTCFMQQEESYKSAEGNILLLTDNLACLDCSGNDLKEQINIKGVINLWGALTDTALIDADENIPLLLIHGSADDIVPPNHSYPFNNVGGEISKFFSYKVFGSESIQQHSENLGHEAQLLLLNNAGHEPHLDENNQFNENWDIIVNAMDKFLFSVLSKDKAILKGKFTLSSRNKLPVYKIEGKGKLRTQWMIRGGKIIEYNKDSTQVKAVWFAHSKNHMLSCKVLNENGLLSKLFKKLNINKN